jgi:membrane fusion protein, heavy metal efflux system
MSIARRALAIGIPVVVIGAAVAGFFTREQWWQAAPRPGTSGTATTHEESPIVEMTKVKLSDQAILNLGITSKFLQPETYWKTLEVPGQIVDRPGYTDRGIVSPLAGIVAKIHHFPGDTLRPGDSLFTIRVLSEALQQTQTDLFKSTQDLTLAEEQKKRLLLLGGSVSEARLIEAENLIVRLRTAQRASRIDLANRGLSPTQIDEAAAGKFVNEILVSVPVVDPQTSQSTGADGRELQDLKVDLGQQVQAGQTLCLLANHRLLAIEGQAFREETPLLERAVRENWPIEVDFQEAPASGWSPFEQPLKIRTISNTIDPATRTFRFQIPIDNPFKTIERDKRTLFLWRFRPGHAVRLKLRVDRLDDVYVVPVGAIVRDGGEAYVFRQSGEMFERVPVQILHQDRLLAVLSSDNAKLRPGTPVALAGATSLNRMLKSGGGLPPGTHMHADGSIHGAH